MNQVSPLAPPFPPRAVYRPTFGTQFAARANAASLRRPMFLFLILVSLSYWYCLPIATQSLIRYSEFRGYDILLIGLIATLLFKYRARLGKFFRQEGSGRWIFRFSLWATATFIVTIVSSIVGDRVSWAFVTLIFLFHLWGFVLVFAAIRIFVKTRAQCYLLLDTFLVCALIEAGIISLQGLGFLPRFWSDLYAGYGAMAFSGTLGPNRTMPGHAMVLAIGVAFSYGRNFRTVGWKRGMLALGTAAFALVALGMTASRTAWAACIVFAVFSVIGRRPQPALIAFVMLVAVTVFSIVPETAEQRISEIYQWRVASKLATPGSVENEEAEGAVSTIEKLDPRRVELWTEGVRAIIARPYLIPFGGGFNNYRYSVAEGVSAHNLYITLIGEVGLIGLLLYLGWLRGIWRESSSLTRTARKLKKRGAKVFLPVDMQALLIAFMVSLLAGEILYPYRPAFTFLGMFLFVCAVLNHRSLVLGDDQPEMRSQRHSARGRRSYRSSLRFAARPGEHLACVAHPTKS
jgi:O-antigen ligase